jgi:hypothetical protein
LLLQQTFYFVEEYLSYNFVIMGDVIVYDMRTYFKKWNSCKSMNY